jgi:glycosyltransferase involved in cell wall biosynthesis
MSGVSILILTLDEETNIAACIESCCWSDDIVVFDSYSTDRTPQIAVEKGARLFQRTFDDYAGQRNAALAEVNFKYPWVLMVDADERTPADLASEIRGAVANCDSETVLFRIRRKDFFLGKWLRRSSGYTSWFGRLVRLGSVRIERAVNEEYIADGKIEYLDSHLAHFPFNKGVEYWIARHNRYSTMESLAKLESRASTVSVKAIFGMDPIARRRHLKHFVYRLSMRPVVIFLYLYVIRLGLLDGVPGMYFCALRASYELFIDLKVIELERRGGGLPV